ncbi:MAG: DUF1840 domain-containing protein [Comamonas sp.]|uniref:DUF1840 domain-containing protein n=1 Tax=Comamonas sp. lk TaxID=2201272 RepID=UPI000EACA695|nr:DUF1840 domain-containing protein [Comamonas sp. lk]
MLYKFKSRATADLIMLEANGRQVLEIMGKPLEAHGIVTVEQIPAAIAALEAAVAEDAARRAATGADDADEAEEDTSSSGAKDGVSLGRRVAPLVEMLRRSAAEGREVTW